MVHMAQSTVATLQSMYWQVCSGQHGVHGPVNSSNTTEHVLVGVQWTTRCTWPSQQQQQYRACIGRCVVDNMVYMAQSTVATLQSMYWQVCSGQHGVHGTVNSSNTTEHVLVGVQWTTWCTWPSQQQQHYRACIGRCVVDNMVYMAQSTVATLQSMYWQVCSGQHGVHGTVNSSNTTEHVLVGVQWTTWCTWHSQQQQNYRACIGRCVVDNMVYMAQSTVATLQSMYWQVCSGQHGEHGPVNSSNTTEHVLVGVQWTTWCTWHSQQQQYYRACIGRCVVDNMVYMAQSTVATLQSMYWQVRSGQHGVHGTVNSSNTTEHVLVGV